MLQERSFFFHAQVLKSHALGYCKEASHLTAEYLASVQVYHIPQLLIETSVPTAN